MVKKNVLFTLLAVCFFSITAMAQDNLENISKGLFLRSNENYILIDAYKDGLLKEGQDFELTVEKGVFSLDGVAISEPMQTLYFDKWRVFLLEQKKSDYTAYSLRISSTLRLKKIEDPKYYLRNPEKEDAATTFNLKTIDNIVKMMIADKLINEEDGFTIEYKNNNVKVNNEWLTSSMKKKYVALLKKATVNSNDSSFYIGTSGKKIHLPPQEIQID